MIQITSARAERKRKRTAQSQSLALHYGDNRTPLARVVPDDEWPDMWRVVWPDGSQSDIVNLTRAKDAAAVIAGRSAPSRNPALFRWAWCPNSLGAPQTRETRPDHAEVADGWIDWPAAPESEAA